MHLLLAVVLFLQANTDALLARFAGNWSGSGTVLNQPAKISMSWALDLDGQFMRLSFRNEMPKNTFEGHAYYRPAGSPSTALGAGDRYRGMWFDNSGMFRPLEAHREGDSLVSKWGTPQTEEGETTYRLMSDTRMDIIDRVKSKDGTWREFGRTSVEKVR
jgi:hypothetical protein